MKNKISVWGIHTIGFVVILLIAIFSYTTPYQSIENKLLDLRFNLRTPITVSDRITHIDIDNQSIEKIGRWPWSRHKHAELLEVLSELGAEAIVFDVDFLEPSNRIFPDQKVIADVVSNSLLILLKGPSDKNIAQDKYQEYLSKIGQNIYDEMWNNADIDRIFSRALKQCGNVYLTINFPNNEIAQENILTGSGNSFLINYLPEKHHILRHQEYIQLPVIENARGLGFVGIEPDKDGILRRLSLVREYQKSLYPQLAFRVACDILGVSPDMINIQPDKNLELKRANQPTVIMPVDNQGRVLINWAGNYKTEWKKIFEHISYCHLTETIRPILIGESNLSEEEQKERLEELSPKIKDKICLIGMVATGSTDLKPTSNESLTPGVMVHSNLINMLLTDSFIHHLPEWVNLLIIIGCGVLVTFLAGKLNPKVSVILTVLVISAYSFIAFEIFSGSGIWIDLTGPLFVGFFSFASVTAYRTVREEQAKRQVKHIFGHYLSPQVINELLRHPEKLKLGGEKRMMSVFFSDIANFTNNTSGLAPEVITEFINRYLSEMTDIIQSHSGMIDKYEGDAIMALFGAPLERPDHAKLACWSALDNIKQLIELNRHFKRLSLPEIDVRIGINTGEMVVGNLGSSKVLSYTVMGEEVILASRLEGVNKLYQTRILAGENTYQQAKDDIEAREIDCIRAKGMDKAVRIYEVLAKKGEANSSTMELINKYTLALEAYRSREWDKAADLFNACLKIKPDDGASLYFLDQCYKLKLSPPPPNWDAIQTLTSK